MANAKVVDGREYDVVEAKTFITACRERGVLPQTESSVNAAVEAFQLSEASGLEAPHLDQTGSKESFIGQSPYRTAFSPVKATIDSRQPDFRSPIQSLEKQVAFTFLQGEVNVQESLKQLTHALQAKDAMALFDKLMAALGAKQRRLRITRGDAMAFAALQEDLAAQKDALDASEKQLFTDLIGLAQPVMSQRDTLMAYSRGHYDILKKAYTSEAFAQLVDLALNNDALTDDQKSRLKETYQKLVDHDPERQQAALWRQLVIADSEAALSHIEALQQAKEIDPDTLNALKDRVHDVRDNLASAERDYRQEQHEGMPPSQEATAAYQVAVQGCAQDMQVLMAELELMDKSQCVAHEGHDAYQVERMMFVGAEILHDGLCQVASLDGSIAEDVNKHRENLLNQQIAFAEKHPDLLPKYAHTAKGHRGFIGINSPAAEKDATPLTPQQKAAEAAQTAEFAYVHLIDTLCLYIGNEMEKYEAVLAEQTLAQPRAGQSLSNEALHELQTVNGLLSTLYDARQEAAAMSPDGRAQLLENVQQHVNKLPETSPIKPVMLNVVARLQTVGAGVDKLAEAAVQGETNKDPLQQGAKTTPQKPGRFQAAGNDKWRNYNPDNDPQASPDRPRKQNTTPGYENVDDARRAARQRAGYESLNAPLGALASDYDAVNVPLGPVSHHQTTAANQAAKDVKRFGGLPVQDGALRGAESVQLKRPDNALGKIVKEETDELHAIKSKPTLKSMKTDIKTLLSGERTTADDAQRCLDKLATSIDTLELLGEAKPDVIHKMRDAHNQLKTQVMQQFAADEAADEQVNIPGAGRGMSP